MCKARCSESGKLLSISPCNWYQKLESELKVTKAALVVAQLRCGDLERQCINIEVLKDEIIRERDVAERALELGRQECGAPRWTEYDGTSKTLPNGGKGCVLIELAATNCAGKPKRLYDFWCFKVDKETYYWCNANCEIQIGDRWMPWPEGAE